MSSLVCRLLIGSAGAFLVISSLSRAEAQMIDAAANRPASPQDRLKAAGIVPFDESSERAVPDFAPSGPADAGEPLFNLQGVVLVSDTRRKAGEDPRLEGVQKSAGVHIIGLETPEPEGLKALVREKYLGRPVSLNTLNQMVVDVIQFYRNHDRPMTHVYIPEQDVFGGVVLLAVSEGRIGNVGFKRVNRKGEPKDGMQWYSDKYVFGRFDFPQGELVEGGVIREQLNAFNRSPWDRLGEETIHPFRVARAEFSPGDEIGLTDLTVSITESRPFRLFGGYENSGVVALGTSRFIVGGVYYNLWNLDHQVGFQYITGTDYDRFHGWVTNYRAIIPKLNHFLDVFYTRAKSKTEGISTGGGISTADGASWWVGLRYGIPLPGIGAGAVETRQERVALDYTDIRIEGEVIPEGKVAGPFSWQHEVGIGFDFKSIENSVIFGGLTIFESPPQIAQGVLEYRARERDPLGRTVIDVQAFFSPGNITDKNTDEVFETARPDAEANYIYGRATILREFDLPWGMIFRSEVIGQASNRNLLASEQLGAGGYDTVRGYEPREVLGDYGLIVRTEFLSPPISPAALVAGLLEPGNPEAQPLFKDEFVLLGFFDYGLVGPRNPLPGQQNPIHLSSAGFGIRYQISNHLSLRFDYGWTFDQTGFSVNDQKGRGDVGVLVSF